MNTALSFIKRTSTYGAVLFVTAFSPLIATGFVAADGDTTSTPPKCTAPANNQNGVHWPVGADADTFTYNCTGGNAGYYTNAYYKYDPITTQRTALYSPDYAFDCSTGKWSMTVWNYSPGTSSFSKSRVTPDSAPSLPTNCPVATVPSTGSGSSTGASGTGQANTGSGQPGSTVGTTGPGSSNSTNNGININSNTTNNNALTMSNGITMQAGTGNTFVIGNTTGGSAASGNAQSVANIANMLQSTSNVFGPGTTTFVANINGDVNGDFMFDPSALISNTGPDSANSTNNKLQVNTNNTNNTDAQINNDINVGATSGNATVANNTNGGNATTGDANAIVNLMNLINSTVSSSKSFVGTVNINGNLNGDILLPQGLIDQLLASTGPNSANNTNTDTTNSSTTTNNTNEGIANNINSTAQTGSAGVSNNTNGGTATSGTANTNVTLLNLTGSNTVGKDNILVFVNVLGHWVGMIVNAPQGSTAASLGGGISSTGPNSANSSNTSLANNSTVTNNTNEGITNNVNVHANSGNASVAGNTTGGNATSGNANTAVNILNLEGSNLNLSDWFGVLFINVFGNWTGSFGVNTSAGDPVAVASTTVATDNSNPATPAATPQFATFIGRTTTSTGSGSGVSNDASATLDATTASSVLGSKVTKNAAKTTPTADTKTHADYTLPVIGASVALLMLVGERVVTNRKGHKV